MNLVVLRVLVAVALMGGVAGKLLPPQGSYKVLMLLPVSARSHRSVFVAVAEALAERGHQVRSEMPQHPHMPRGCLDLYLTTSPPPAGGDAD